ncbi:MAG: DUF3306 domain-containing protein [Geminicoccaceae bacterium]
MAEGERPFLARWSERKRQARVRELPGEAVPAASDPQAGGSEAGEPEAAFDPASLPPVESLGPGSDIAAFLKKGVPAALRRAALRRIWVADPKVKGFREVADYDWDFNAPGYGALLPTDDAGQAAERLLARLRQPVAAPAEPAAAASEPVAGPTPEPPEPAPAGDGERLAALPAAPEADEPAPVLAGRRRHGGATPR